MITAATIQQLKQVNISVDGEKTKERVSALWKGASKEDRETILSLANLVKASVQRSYTTGSISIKLVIAFAQTLNVNPLFLTGEMDERGECTDGQLTQLLQTHGYSDLLAGQPTAKAKRRPSVKSKAEPAMQEGPVLEQKERVECVDQAIPTNVNGFRKDLSRYLEAAITPEKEAFMESMTGEDMILLMRAIMLKAKVSSRHAELAKLLKLLLIQ